MPAAATHKQLGQFFTPDKLAQWLIYRLLHLTRDVFRTPNQTLQIFDPAMGEGQFFKALMNQPLLPACNLHLIGAEIDRPTFQTAYDQLALLTHPLADVQITQSLYHANSLHWFQHDEPIPANSVDWVIGNPPYIGEKGNRAFFQSTLSENPKLQQVYHGRMDYCYFFLDLALEKLKPGGWIAYLLPRYWLTAESGQKLRNRLLESSDGLELVDFNDNRLFPQAPGHHSLILFAQKRLQTPSQKQNRWISIPTQSRVPLTQRLPNPEQPVDALTQALQFQPNSRWFQPSGSDVLNELLAQLQAHPTRIKDCLDDQQGIISGADRATADKSTTGKGIFLLNEQEVHGLQLTPFETRFIKSTYKSSQIKPYHIEQEAGSKQHLLYLTRHSPTENNLSEAAFLETIPNLIQHLIPFQAHLSHRREVQQGRIPWWALHWPRSEAFLNCHSLVTPRRSTSNRFALSTPDRYESSDCTILLPKEPNTLEARLFYLAFLNSTLFGLWMEHRGKAKGFIREYFSGPLREAPCILFDQTSKASDIIQLSQTCCDYPQESKSRRAALDHLLAECFSLNLATKQLLAKTSLLQRQ